MAKQPESRPGVDDGTGQHIWTWNTSFGTTSVYHVACLSGATFHLRLSILTTWGRNKIVHALRDGVPPETAITGKRSEISLASIRELRYSEEAAILEIHFGAKAPAVLECYGTPSDARSTQPCGRGSRRESRRPPGSSRRGTQSPGPCSAFARRPSSAGSPSGTPPSRLFPVCSACIASC